MLYNFCSLANCADGFRPSSVLVFDRAGNLYGTTANGGSAGDYWFSYQMSGCGTVFKLAPNSDGSWTESVLYSFCPSSGSTCPDGAFPSMGIIFDPAGNLYGAAGEGPGPADVCGVVFKLAPNSKGSWTENVIHCFLFQIDGPQVTFDSAKLYGTTDTGGPAGDGRVFELARLGQAEDVAYTVLRYFYGKPSKLPVGGVVLDKAGNLYGVTELCGSGYTCQGLVYEVTP